MSNTIYLYTWAYSHKYLKRFVMKNNFRQKKLVKIVCQCCGEEFYTENDLNFCPKCEKHWNED